MATKVKDFEIVNHGYEHAQYFQGCGVSFTRFEHVATGAGHTARDAYGDACEQICMVEGCDVGLPKRPAGIRQRDHVPASHCGEESEFYWYVSIRYNVEEG
jgi:hypothetical protein